MNLKKPKFWDYKKPNIVAYILTPIALLINIFQFLNFKFKNKNKLKIKTICVGNFYLGGTGKTSLSIKINKILKQRQIRACFVKKKYEDQIDEQKILKNEGKLFINYKRIDAISQAEKENFEVAICDDGLQDKSVDYDLKFVCFNTINWVGNGLTLPAGPLREKLNNLNKYEHVFLNGNLGLTIGRDSVEGTFIDGSNIPRMVPARDIYTLSYTEDNLSVDIDLTEVNAQSDIGGVGDSATAGFELLDLSVGRSFALEGVEDFRVILFANNLLNEIARNHSSTVKNEVPLPGKNLGIGFRVTL
mgnify:CR=1 FL=1